MPLDVLLGLQWGDEGKGKVVDRIAPRYRMVARFQGGPNAGHTLVHEGVRHVLHQVPSGIFHDQIDNVIGNGVVLDGVVLSRELTELRARGLSPERNLIISRRAQLILPTHRLLDAALEAGKGEGRIGSTLRGIGPAYQDKYNRTGLRVGQVTGNEFSTLYTRLRDRHLRELEALGADLSPLEGFEEAFWAGIETLRGLRLADTEYLLNDHLSKGDAILAEGAQGALLDIDFGAYPYVTSSTTTSAGACSGLGVAPGRVRHVYGVFKAYATRVGGGPFPTELHDEAGERIRVQGREFGSTTGRPRRTGWLDLPALSYATMLSGVTELLMMKADVLTGFGELQVAEAYRTADGALTRHFTSEDPTLSGGATPEPVYTTLPGWDTLPNRPGSWEALPTALRHYITYIEGATGLPVTLLSTGPDREETLELPARRA